MNKNIKTIVIGICTMGIAIGLIGCGSSEKQSAAKATEEYKPAVCYVIANTACSQGINWSSPLVQDTVLDCAKHYGTVALISADSNCEFLGAESLDVEEKYKTAGEERLNMDARNKANNVLAYMETVIADDPEVDYLEALRLACRTMSSLEGYTSKTIIVLGTGLSTAGDYLNFSNNLISAEPSVIADMLEEKEAIPDFTNITVYWQGMADTAAPQKALTPAQRAKLQNIWKEVITRGGGELVLNDFISNPVNDNIEYPEVSTINLPAETPIAFESKALETMTEGNAFEEPIALGESQVEFVRDESNYLHPDDAEETIRPIAEYLLQHESVDLLLIGCTAGDVTDEFTLRLSQERADAVRNTLLEFGIDAGRICAVGMGSNDPWHVPDAGFDGPVASSNRKVVLIDASTDQAKEVLHK